VILSIIFLLILASLIGVNIQLHELIRQGKNDFSYEDDKVLKAEKRIPQITPTQKDK
jgi:hypothetical protein